MFKPSFDSQLGAIKNATCKANGRLRTLRYFPALLIALSNLGWSWGWVRAQDANEMYKDTGNDRRRYEAIQQQNKQIIQGVFYQALSNGKLWRCESNVYLFYDGRVFVGSKDDTSDMGKVPFNIVGSYLTKDEFITFVFPALPYDNTFELNTRTHDLYTYKSTNNKITKTNCKTIEREKK